MAGVALLLPPTSWALMCAVRDAVMRMHGCRPGALPVDAAILACLHAARAAHEPGLASGSVSMANACICRMGVVTNGCSPMVRHSSYPILWCSPYDQQHGAVGGQG